MAKYKIYITKSIEEEIEAENEEQAVDSAWEIFSQADECEIYIEHESRVNYAIIKSLKERK